MVRHTLFVTSILVAALLCASPAIAGEEMVPDVVGLNIQKAQALLEEAGFPMQVESVPGKPLGIVFSQHPGGLSERDTAMTVTLQVGGPTPKPGPALDAPPVSKDPSPAAGDGGIGAPPAGTMERGTTPAPSGAGGKTWPKAPSDTDRPVAQGFSWNGVPVPGEALANTNGPDLPGVLGQTAGRARRSLNQYRVRVEQTNAMPELVGQVLNQWPFAGSKLALGEEVTIVVGVGRLPTSNHRGVPQVQDQPWRKACQAVKRAGFSLRLTAVPSPNSKRGVIVMQTPLPGSLLELGQGMHLRIGAGSGRYVPGNAETSPPASNESTGEGPVKAPADDAGAPPAGAGTPPIGTPPTRTPPADAPPRDVPTERPPTQSPPADEPSTGPSLSAPALRTPPAGESYPFKYGADFTWTAVASATAYELEIQEEMPSGIWKKLSSNTVTSTRFRPKRLERGRYRWRVRAVRSGATGRWSDFRRLYMY